MTHVINITCNCKCCRNYLYYDGYFYIDASKPGMIILNSNRYFNEDMHARFAENELRGVN